MTLPNKPDHNKSSSNQILQKLRKLARAEATDLQRLLTRYGIERFLYRLSLSQHALSFTVKGAVLFSYWLPGQLFHRATKDLDLLGRGESSHQHLKVVFEDICSVETEEDGLVFDPSSLIIEAIRPEESYGGSRIRLGAKLGKTRIPLQIDIGFGDSVVPKAEHIDFPSLLDQNKPRVSAYSKASVVAEKFQAMISLDVQNSRMKDFFDLYILSKEFAFQGSEIQSTIISTFEKRATAVPKTLPSALQKSFVDSRLTMWANFLRKSDIEPTIELQDVMEKLGHFLWPICEAIQNQETLGEWPPGGPWP